MLTLPTAPEAEQILRPPGELEAEIRAFLHDQLGRVLPGDDRRGLGGYYDWVVLGGRSLEALRVLLRCRDGSDLRVLDIGSGLGTTVLLANLCGVSAIGVEPGEEEVALARRRAEDLGVSSAAFRRGVGEHLPVDDASVSAALLHDVLEHVGDWRAVLTEAHRVIAPGGVLCVKGPSYSVRFFEPHYKVPWLPLLPKPAARTYLRALGRDPGYLEHVGYRRRGAVLAQLRDLGFELSFPRLEKLRNPASINRAWVRGSLERLRNSEGTVPAFIERLAESPLQSTIDVVARRTDR